MIKIFQAQHIDDIGEVRLLFLEYADALGIDLSFQNFADELKQLPGNYAPPQGRLLLAHYKNKLAGCIALRPLDERGGEIKRLYVRSPYRKKGVGIALARAVIAEAKKIGYASLKLDTLKEMRAATMLYKKLGFVEIAPYYRNPIPETIFLELPI